MISASMSVSRSGSPIDPEKYIKAIVSELDENALEVQTEFKLSTSTWNDKPEFIIKKSGEYERQIVTSNENYARLDKGTKVRYAVMTQDFIAKSQAGSLAARPGSGGVLRFSKTPLPGIAARNFVKTMYDHWLGRFPFNMRVAIDNARV